MKKQKLLRNVHCSCTPDGRITICAKTAKPVTFDADLFYAFVRHWITSGVVHANDPRLKLITDVQTVLPVKTKEGRRFVFLDMVRLPPA